MHEKKLTIALGATPIGSAGRAPNADESIKFEILERRVIIHTLEYIIGFIVKTSKV
jgi:hypothetical protein